MDRYELRDTIREEMKKKEKLEESYQAEAAAAAAAGASGAAADGDGADGGGDGLDADLKIDEGEAAGFGKVEKRVNTAGGGSTSTIRNLRIREDTAKYLLNLDVASAHYDPKSRSMREDPNPDRPAAEKQFVGDNFVRQSGAEYAAWAAVNVYSLQAHDRGQDVHLQAVPSAAEALFQQFKQKKELLARASKVDVLAKYGQAAEAPPEDLLGMVASERCVLPGFLGGAAARCLPRAACRAVGKLSLIHI